MLYFISVWIHDTNISFDSVFSMMGVMAGFSHKVIAVTVIKKKARLENLSYGYSAVGLQEFVINITFFKTQNFHAFRRLLLTGIFVRVGGFLVLLSLIE